MYDWLLFLHVTAAFFLVITVVVLSAPALGYATDKRLLTIATVAWGIGGLGTILFGIWLAIYVRGYEVWDGWVIAAIVLWAGATELGRRAETGFNAGEGEPARARAAMFHWLRTGVVILLLIDMIYKPGH
ncbi:MAG TPA: hypothetical protein VN606_07455 [Thermoleophilaceae bacterium]|nr:hypothetical protein [Thermoleophilaceae bacterium]